MNLNIKPLNTYVQKGKVNVDFVKVYSATCFLSGACSTDEEENCFTEEYSHPRHWQNTEVYINLLVVALWGISKCISIFRSSYQHFKDKVV